MCIVQRIVHEIDEGRGVEVGEGGQSTAEVCRVLLCSKHTAKPDIVSLLHARYSHSNR